MAPSDLGNQRCTNCGLVKILADFHRDRRRKSGRAIQCKVCVSDYYKSYYKDNKKSVNDKNSRNYYNNRKRRINENVEYTRQRRASDPLFRENERLRRLIKRYRSVGASKSEVDDHRLVSRETYLLWLSYQQNCKKVADGYVVDHSYPQARLNVNNPIDRLIATNIVNFSPMLAADNASKSCKIIPELLANQISVANAFLATADLSYDEKLKFRFLTEMFTAYVRFNLGIE